MQSQGLTSNPSNQMHVLQVPHVYLPHIGGVQFYTFHLSKYLKAHGVHVEVLSTSNSFRVRKRSYSGIKTTWVPAFPNVGGNPLSPALFIKQLKMSPTFDLLHAHPPQLAATFYSTIIRKCLSKKPLVITSHGFATPDYFSSTMLPLLRFANAGARFSLVRADAIIALTSHERSLLVRMAGPKISDKIHVIPNATDISHSIVNRYDPVQSRKRLGNNKHFIVLFVGTLRWQKGVRYLIESIRKIPTPNCTLIIAGDGIQRKELENSIPSKLANQIQFIGKVDRTTLFTYYAACDVVVNPSLHEGFPTILPEAWMFSKPVILTDIPAHREIIDTWKGGLLVKPKSSHDLAQAIQFAMNHPDVCKTIGREGHKAASSYFSWPVVGEKILTLYKQVLNG